MVNIDLGSQRMKAFLEDSNRRRSDSNESQSRAGCNRSGSRAQARTNIIIENEADWPRWIQESLSSKLAELEGLDTDGNSGLVDEQ